MSKGSWSVLSLFLGLLILHPGAARAEVSAQGVEDRLIIAFKSGVSVAEQRKVIESQGLLIVDEIPALRAFLAQAKPGQARIAFNTLRSRTEILRVDKDLWRNWLESESVSFQQTPMPRVEEVLQALPKLRPEESSLALPRRNNDEAPWGVKRVNAPAAWARNQGAGVKVAIVDTGIDPNHPDLKDKIAGGINTVEKDAPWADDHFHGTHVAGTVAAALDNKGVAGVAPKATLYAVKVLTKEGGGNVFSIMQGIMWCAQNGIQVANMSLGAPQEIPFLQYAIQMAANAGVTIVAAAGNDGKAVNWPAAYPETIAVSALCPTGVTNAKLCPSQSEGISTFSSRGPEIDFIAPGVLIPSSVPLSHDASGVKAYSGTSMACPHVAGLAALAVAKGAQGPEAVRAALTAAASGLPGLSQSEQGAGLVDAARLAR